MDPSTDNDVEPTTLDTLFRRRLQEIRHSRPLRSDIDEMLAAISVAATRDREKEPPNELESAELSLRLVVQFLEKQAGLMEQGDFQPLLRLHRALCDLIDGKQPDMLRPKKSRKGGRPRSDSLRTFYQARAARALSDFFDAGEDLEQSARRIAREVKVLGRSFRDVEWSTIVNWRERLEQGAGYSAAKLEEGVVPGATKDAVLEYLISIPGQTPKERGENFMKAIARRGRFTV